MNVTDGETTVADLTLGPYGTISGKVLDNAGQPVAGLRISNMGDERAFLASLAELPEMMSLGMAQTDEEGRFTMNHLLAGEYKLYVTHQSRHIPRVAATVHVEADKDTVTNITWEE